MKPHFVLLAALAAASLLAFAQPTGKLGEPWMLAGQNPDHYEIGVDSEGYTRGSHAKYLRAKNEKEEGWATLMQQFSAKEYQGKRVRFTAAIKTRDIGAWAGLWLRVDRPGPQVAAFYNSGDKPIKGTTDWQTRSVVLDVAQDASTVSFGVIGAGKGAVLIDDLKLEAVGKDVPVDSAQPRVPSLASRPSL